MTQETIQLLSGSITLVVIITSRVLSHFEHKKTENKITDIHIKLNGDLEERIKTAVQEALKK